MSNPEQKSLATTNESCAANVSILTGHLLAGIGELVELNLAAYRSMLDGSKRSWESVLSVQSPEQLVRAQADLLPSLAAQMSAYTSEWMDIASATAAKLGQFALDCQAGSSRQVATMFAEMTGRVRGGEAMLRAVMRAPDDTDGAAAVRARVASQNTPGTSPAPAAVSSVTRG